jgi:hypothetical protein
VIADVGIRVTGESYAEDVEVGIELLDADRAARGEQVIVGQRADDVDDRRFERAELPRRRIALLTAYLPRT